MPPDPLLAGLRCPCCGRGIALYVAELAFLLKTDWPRCCGGEMLFHRSADGSDRVQEPVTPAAERPRPLTPSRAARS